MTAIPAERTLAELVAERSQTTRVFERLGIDYCCHGDRTLDEACRDAGYDTDAVTELLDAVAAAGGDDDWVDLPIPDLADHIVATHHRYLREELPLVGALAAKVLAAHGRRHPELVAVRDLVDALRADLFPHMDKEERVLIPAIHEIYQGRRDFPFGTVANPTRMMRVEHDRVGKLLASVRETTSAYQVPADGCASYRALYARLEALEHDTYVHVHKENFRLFPAAIAEESRSMEDLR
jgi:regulator of cell morphogenesis and NO signaling